MKRLLFLLPVVMLAAMACAADPPAPTPPPGPAIGTCFNAILGQDAKYTAYNQLNNVTPYNSTDGSCTLGLYGGPDGTAVVAADHTAALALCQSLNPLFTIADQLPSGFLTPDPGPLFWVCS